MVMQQCTDEKILSKEIKNIIYANLLSIQEYLRIQILTLSNCVCMGDIYQQISDENTEYYGTRIGEYGPTLLAHLYSDKTHFIYELIQNAEDACSRSRERGDKREYYISFQLFDDKLECRHNGIEFDGDDIRGICSIKAGTKENDPEQIGKFGIGFKSVYAYTKSPEVYSLDKSFCINAYVHPSKIEKRNDVRADETLFVMYFNNGEINQEQAKKGIQEKLKNLGLRTLLFLKNINIIKCKVDGQEWLYSKQSKDESYVELSFLENNILQKNEKWLILSKSIPEMRELVIEVAYLLGNEEDNNSEFITAATDTALVATFQTQKETGLKFLIQGPYQTTPPRDNIYINEWNKKLIFETAALVADTVSIIKNKGLCNVKFIETLPIQKGVFPEDSVFKPIYDAVLSKFRTEEELLPSADGSYVSTGNAAIARTEDLRKLVTTEQLRLVFEGKRSKWLDGAITEDKTPELIKYLMQELEIPEINPQRFVQGITEEFLKSQDDEWIIKFYQFLSGQKALIKILKTKPIIRLENNKHVAAYNEQEIPQVYLPTNMETNYPTVKRTVASDGGALDFLKMLGLENPDVFAEIREVIVPKYKQSNSIKDESYIEDFKIILNGYEIISANKKEEFLKQLKHIYFVDSVNNSTGERVLLRPIDVYQDTPDLIEYFRGYPVFFVSKELYKNIENKKLVNLLKDLGVSDSPRRIILKKVMSEEEKLNLRHGSQRSRDVCERDYSYEGLKNLLERIDIEKSCLLWRLLLKNIKNKKEDGARSFFKGIYTWFYYNEQHNQFDAKFLKQLKSQRWLFDKKGNLNKPGDISFDNLADCYVKESNNLKILVDSLEISKPIEGIIKQLPLEQKKKLEITEGMSSEQVKEAIENYKAQESNQDKINNKEEWKADYEPDMVVLTIDTVNPEKIVTPDLEGQSKELVSKTKEENKEEETNPKASSTNLSEHKQKVDIGKWGEKYVYRALKEQYEESGNIIETEFGFKTSNSIEVIWLNKEGNRGEGYDFTIKKYGIETDYIEVKSTTADASELMEITGTQWGFARKLYDADKGDKYYIYVVQNAGKANAKIIKIQNPIKLWNEGKLYAQPVRFKLPPDNR